MSFPHHNHHPDIIYAQPRPRAYSTLPSFPHGPPDYIAPKFTASTSRQVSSHPIPTTDTFPEMDTLPPIPPPTPFTGSPLRLHPSQAHFHAQLPQIRCPSTLLAAVQTNPEHIFTRLVSVINERDALKRDFLSLNEDFAHARKDWKCAREKYEELVDIGLAKQVVLWKFVERLRFGENGGVDGNGMRCKGGMSETSELSEGSSEGGGWSWVGEGKGLVGCGGVGLDPNAVSSLFPPSLFLSSSFLPTLMREHQMLIMSTAIIHTPIRLSPKILRRTIQLLSTIPISYLSHSPLPNPHLRLRAQNPNRYSPTPFLRHLSSQPHIQHTMSSPNMQLTTALQGLQQRI
jgi:hypothetical protein